MKGASPKLPLRIERGGMFAQARRFRPGFSALAEDMSDGQQRGGSAS